MHACVATLAIQLHSVLLICFGVTIVDRRVSRVCQRSIHNIFILWSAIKDWILAQWNVSVLQAGTIFFFRISFNGWMILQYFLLKCQTKVKCKGKTNIWREPTVEWKNVYINGSSVKCHIVSKSNQFLYAIFFIFFSVFSHLIQAHTYSILCMIRMKCIRVCVWVTVDVRSLLSPHAWVR